MARKTPAAAGMPVAAVPRVNLLPRPEI